MKIVIHRTRVRQDYTLGQLSIDGLKVCDTLENPRSCLPAGEYPIVIRRCHQYGRQMMLIDPSTKLKCAGCRKLDFICINTTLPLFCPMLKPGNGVHNRLDGSILIGECSVPGLIIHPRQHFDALFERVRKSVARGNSVQLQIINPV